MTRNGPEWSNPGIAPKSRRRGCGPASGSKAEPRDLIRDYLLQRVEHGAVRNRADVVAALREAGAEVPCQGDRIGQRRTGSTHGADGVGFEPTRADAHTISSRAP